MSLINLKNQLTEQTGIQTTYLGGTIAVGGTTSPVKNIAGFRQNWAVQLGQTGEEIAEIMVISGVPAGTALNFGTAASNTQGTFKFAHAIDTPLYQIHYDQVILNRSTAGTSGPFSALGTYNITPDNSYTQIDDSTGAVGYAYYAQYYNSVSGDLSGSSSIFIPGGPLFYSLQKLRSRIKGKLYSSGFIRSDNDITDWINEWYEQMNNTAIKVNQDYLQGTSLVSFGTSGYGTITDTSFKQIVKMEVTWDGTNYMPSTQIPRRDFSEQDWFDLAAPQHSWYGDMVFEILPHRQAGTVRATYATRFTPLTNDSDTLPNVMQAYTTSFVEYGLAQAYGVDQKQDYQTHMQTAMQGKQDFIDEITPRDMTGSENIDIIDGISGNEDDLSFETGEFFF